MDNRAHLNQKSGNRKYQQSKLDESLVPVLEDEAAKVKHLIGPKPGNVSVDSELYLNKENPWKHLEIEDFYYGFDFDMKRNGGGLNCITEGQNEMELGDLDGLLDDIDEVDDIHAADDIFGTCEDFLLDIELADKIGNLDHAPSGRSHVENSSSGSQSPGFSGSSNGVIGLSDSSRVPKSECKNVSAVEKIDHQTLVEYTTSLDLQPLDELDESWPLDSGISSDENEKRPYKMKTVVGQRRLRPSKSEQGPNMDLMNECLKIVSHYENHHVKEESLSETITQESPQVEDDEKLSDLKSKFVTGKRKNSSSVSKDKRVKLGSRIENHHARSPEYTPFDEAVTTSQEPCHSRPRRGCPKKLPSVLVFGSDDEQSESDFEDDRVRRRPKKGGDRRKHNRMWTLSEVTKLIDGIAQYGTGRWTDIKKLSFSSSAHRTPMDLRDKWRNLLRAYSTDKQNKKEKVDNAMRSLPEGVIGRICELAVLHPYPRFTPGGRYIRRKP